MIRRVELGTHRRRCATRERARVRAPGGGSGSEHRSAVRRSDDASHRRERRGASACGARAGADEDGARRAPPRRCGDLAGGRADGSSSDARARDRLQPRLAADGRRTPRDDAAHRVLGDPVVRPERLCRGRGAEARLRCVAGRLQRRSRSRAQRLRASGSRRRERHPSRARVRSGAAWDRSGAHRPRGSLCRWLRLGSGSIRPTTKAAEDFLFRIGMNER